MILDVNRFALLVAPAEGMRPIGVKVVTDGSSVVGQEHQTSVVGLGNVGEEIKPSVVIEQERFRVSLLRSDIVRTLERIPDEEDGKVQADKIIVSILGVKLDGVTSRVSCFIGIFSTVRDGGETAEDGGFLADGGEEGGLGEVADVLGDDEFTKGGPAAGVDDSFLDLGSVKCLGRDRV